MRFMSNFFKSIFDNNYPVLIDQSIKDIKQHFLKIIEKKKKITTEDVLDFIKKNDFSLNSLDDKPKKNTDQFDFVFKDNLKPFLYILFLNEMPERFCIEVIGNDDYSGFLLSSDSDKKEIRIKASYVDFVLKEKPTKSASELKEQMLKMPNYINY